MMEWLVTAIGLVCVIEGTLYALAPGKIKLMLAQLMALSDDRMRMVGVVAAAFGVLLVWMVRMTGA